MVPAKVFFGGTHRPISNHNRRLKTTHEHSAGENHWNCLFELTRCRFGIFFKESDHGLA